MLQMLQFRKEYVIPKASPNEIASAVFPPYKGLRLDLGGCSAVKKAATRLLSQPAAGGDDLPGISRPAVVRTNHTSKL